MSEGEVRRDHTGAASLDAGETDARAFVEIAPDDADAEIRVEGTFLDGEPSVVECHVRGGGRAHVTLSFDVDDAHDLAERLTTAAEFAAEGDHV